MPVFLAITLAVLRWALPTLQKLEDLVVRELVSKQLEVEEVCL